MIHVCVHGHFYQPSRVHPGTDPLAPPFSARPFRDWNARIHAECYAPNVSARLLDAEGHTRDTRNNYAWINFHIGPTLLHWFQQNEPLMLEALRQADQDSISRFGSGSAMAQPYHHTILPLATPEERRTEIHWGLAAFEATFQRPAEGMWLPETAVDLPTLEALAAAGVRFTVVSSEQIAAIRPLGVPGDPPWRQARGQHSIAGQSVQVTLPSGATILVVPYPAPLSHPVALGSWPHDGEHMAKALAAAGREGELLLLATAGESYGHHHPGGERALAAMLESLQRRDDVTLTNLASWIAANPPAYEATLRSPSSGSCPHGVERWRSDCGCAADPDSAQHQRWRAPLRKALDTLRDATAHALGTTSQRLFVDPSLARLEYGAVLSGQAAFLDWYRERAPRSGADPEAARSWLEIQRHLLAMYQSGAWFFDEVTGREGQQSIRHAACALGQTLTLSGCDLEAMFREALQRIPGNRDLDRLRETLETYREAPTTEETPVPPIDPQARRAGVLLPVSALPGPGPAGDLDAAIPFLDWLAEAGMSLWQILPLCPPDNLGSPYSSHSTLSGDPAYIGLDWLRAQGLLAAQHTLRGTEQSDYRRVQREKLPLVLLAADALLSQPDHPLRPALDRFIETADWARDAAEFRACRLHHNEAPWWDWPPALRERRPDAIAELRRDAAQTIQQWQSALFLFERHWREVRLHALSRGIQIIGDMPIYVAHDSVDVWCHRDLFQLDETGRPLGVAGVPPDPYSDTGQLWGNPLFDWGAMAAHNYEWWVERVRRSWVHCNAVRIDHFIGFSRYWRVPADADDARNGQWLPGPGSALFDAISSALGNRPLFAEDLGPVDADTIALRDHLGLPGMRVLQFGLDGDPNNTHHPDRYPRHAIAYTGTHDSETARGWWESQSPAHRAALQLGEHGEAAAQALVSQILHSRACWAILPLQDLLSLGNEARFNRPGTTKGNWRWRQPPGVLDTPRAQRLRDQLRRAERLAPQAHRADAVSTSGTGNATR